MCSRKLYIHLQISSCICVKFKSESDLLTGTNLDWICSSGGAIKTRLLFEPIEADAWVSIQGFINYLIDTWMWTVIHCLTHDTEYVLVGEMTSYLEVVTPRTHFVAVVLNCWVSIWSHYGLNKNLQSTFKGVQQRTEQSHSRKLPRKLNNHGE